MEFDLGKIYNRRFRGSGSDASAKSRNNAWEILFNTSIKKYIDSEMTVLDLGSGTGYFINQVKAKKCIAIDLDSNNSKYLNSNVEFHSCEAPNLNFLQNSTVDIIFSSNLFEHLGSSEVLFKTLSETHRVLKSDNSKLIIMMPNVRYVKWDFFNFIDHNLPLNETSLKEALELSNFEIVKSYPKFFPYTANGLEVPIPKLIIRFYLKLIPKIRPMAKQMFFVAKPI